ncbi:polyamine acetyltransferase [Aspergillus aculeatinus CBS 121060]|uniref:Acetyltransferase, GNAT family n=2 Tax=Aspergillus TaxID=5052 RepID=A0A8G1RF37_9EURO|nr:acetyltransferase, GNAT family [Aspergillus aculeatinus CBS 121060]XP_040796152.1 acetyltransferase, GNAT family [Aspergillus fijiensis CBS 313.89]RAH63778.1 acetyltransferase, GNAT family [Aspergillus aculeatinus CBS 121060]RAK72140.1 acetyltransferase, GNAT family [Aspergillus fijiensis CBS 313.89]
MSDESNHYEEPVNGLRPLSNADSFSLPATARELSNHSERVEAARANGLPLEDADIDDEDEEEGEEEVDGEYVSVDHDDVEYPYWFRRPPVHQRTKLDELHPFVQVLTESNVEDCVQVEEAFPQHERCTSEKFRYRLSRCPELCLGLFTLPILREGEPKPRPTLVGHVIATRTSSPVVTDKSMAMPANWQTERMTVENGETVGHDEYGSTIAIHSLAVLPEHQGKTVGSTLMKSYIQRIKDAQIADRLAIIAHGHLIPYYESFGFENRGPSKCQFGGGGWVDLVFDFTQDFARE